MNINSIIEQILGNSATGTHGNIELKDTSQLWNLIHKIRDDESDLGEKFTIQSKIKDDKHWFPITHFIYSIVVYLAQLIVYAFYKVASFIKYIFSGHRCDLSQSPRFNFIVFITACTFFIMMIVAILIFFIKSVLLFKTDASVNECGAITMPQSCERENYMYLLNAATFWGNSGIKVIEGDEVRITVSGSFFSDINEMYNSARNNNKPKYDRTYVTFDTIRKNAPDSSDHSYFLLTNIKNISSRLNSLSKPFHADKDAPPFGSLLVAIRDASEHKPFNQDSIITKKGSDDKPLSFTADRSGYLNFAVNDEYFDLNCFKIIQDSIDLQKRLGIDNIARIDKTQYNTIKNDNKEELHPEPNADSSFYYFTEADLKTIKGNTTLQADLGFKSKVDSLTTWATWNEGIARMWYSDNVGDILINVRIKRDEVKGNIFRPGLMTKSYRSVEDFFLNPKFWKDNKLNLLLFSLFVILWLLFDRFAGKSLLDFAKNKMRSLRSSNRKNRKNKKEESADTSETISSKKPSVAGKRTKTKAKKRKSSFARK